MHRRYFMHRLGGAAAFPWLVTDIPHRSAYAQKNMAVIKPRRLRPGDTIGLVTPATFLTEEELRHAEEKIQQLGFKTRYSSNMLVRKGYLGGSDEQRAADLNQMFADEQVDAIWCGRGGYGSARILPYLDYDLIRNNPKPFLGYSDITSLHYGIHARTGLVTFHGPVAKEALNPFSRRYFEQLLTEGKSTVVFENDMDPVKTIESMPPVGMTKPEETTDKSGHAPEVLVAGTAEGLLVGGNLSLVTAVSGTPYDVDMKGKIVFLEDVGESPARIDRMLTQLLLTENKLQAAAGVVLGVFADCEAEDISKSLSLQEMLQDRLSALKVPVLSGLSFGHIKKNMTLPFGIATRLDTEQKTLTLLEEAVSL